MKAAPTEKKSKVWDASCLPRYLPEAFRDMIRQDMKSFGESFKFYPNSKDWKRSNVWRKL